MFFPSEDRIEEKKYGRFLPRGPKKESGTQLARVCDACSITARF